MRFTVPAVAAALVAGASAQYFNATTLYTTEVVTAYTTYCPAATSIVHGNVTYTVTAAATVTITNCPCTFTKPIVTSTIVSCTGGCTPAVPTSSASAAPTYANSTVVVVAPTTPVTSVVAPIATSSPSITPAPNAANKALAASGARLVGLLGLAAYFL